MRTIALDGLWQGTLPGSQPQPMQVPGCFDSYTEQKDIAQPVIFERQFDLALEKDMQYALSFEAVSYYCEIYVNDQKAGTHEGMWDSFLLDVTKLLRDGENRLRLAVTKPGYQDSDPFPLRQVLSGFIPDVLHTFGGIWGSVKLLESKNVFCEYHFANGDADGTFRFEAGLLEKPSREVVLTVTLLEGDGRQVKTFQKTFGPEKTILRLEGQVENPRLWCPESPAVYTVLGELTCDDEKIPLHTTMGFRTVEGKGSRLLLNGKPLYFRGALHWGYYDDKLIPVPTGEEIDREISGIREYGMNAIKHCLYIPRQNYLNKADREGVISWVELPLWLPDPTPELPQRIRREYPRILRQLAGHPSILLTTLGCELNDGVGSDILSQMYTLVKETTHTLVKDNSGSGECYEGLQEEYADYYDYHFYADLNHFEQLVETFTPTWRNTMPWFFGEFCDSDVLRNLGDVRKAYGVKELAWETNDPHKNPISVLKPDFYAHNHDRNVLLSGIDEDFDRKIQRSVNHSMVHRKVTLEATRSEEIISGYNITTLRDVPLCPNGLFDDMGKPKFDTARFRQSNDDVVLCPAWDLTRIWMTSDRVQYRERYNFYGGSTYRLRVLMSNYGGKTWERPVLCYTLEQDGHTVLQNMVEGAPAVEHGQVRQLGIIQFTLPQVAAPVTYVLKVRACDQGKMVSNEWPIFVYPPRVRPNMTVGVLDLAGCLDTAEEVYNTKKLTLGQKVEGCDAVMTTCLTPEILDYARSGGRVIYLPRGEEDYLLKCPFWREGMLWRNYPSFLEKLDDRCWMDDLRFYSVTADSALELRELPTELRRDYTPILRRYDCRQWLTHDYLGVSRVGEGRIYLTTLRVEGGQGKQPKLLMNNRMGLYLLDEMLTEK